MGRIHVLGKVFYSIKKLAYSGTTIVVAASGLSPIAVARVSAREAVTPNIVMIMTDDQTLEQLRVMTNTKSLIGDKGVTYDNYVVTLPLCCPSRATALTGQYAFRHGVLNNSGPNGGYQAFDNSTALPAWLKTAGYKTAHVGKFLNGYGKTVPTEIPAGWDDWQGQIDVNYYDYRLNDNGTVITYGSAATDYATDVIAARAEQVIAESAPGKPFFLNIAVNAPHNDKTATSSGVPIPAPRHDGKFSTEPLPKPPSYNEADVSDKPPHIASLPLITKNGEKTIVARYRDELESLLAADELVKKVIDSLTASGELSNTVVMFTSDNGFFHGEHRMKTSKAQPYEEAIRVPLLVRGPGFTAGTKVAALTSNIDLAPTIAAIAKATPMLTVDGIDIKTAAASARQEVVIETYDGNCFTGLRTATETYVRYYTGAEEYYDLVTDPYQLKSLHADPAKSARLNELRSKLTSLVPTPPPCQTK